MTPLSNNRLLWRWISGLSLLAAITWTLGMADVAAVAVWGAKISLVVLVILWCLPLGPPPR